MGELLIHANFGQLFLYLVDKHVADHASESDFLDLAIIVEEEEEWLVIDVLEVCQRE